MRIAPLLKCSSIGLSLGLIAFCLLGCEGSDGDGDVKSVAPVFEEGFNPRTLQVNSQVWLVGSGGMSFVSTVTSAKTISHRYTVSGKTVIAEGVPFTYTSLGKSANLKSSFSLTGNQSVYNALTRQLADASSALRVALSALVVSDEATVAAVIKAASDASPGLVIFSENGAFYTLDSLEVDMGNSNEGKQTLVGTPIVFNNNVASEGKGAPKTQVRTVEVSYRDSVHR